MQLDISVVRQGLAFVHTICQLESAGLTVFRDQQAKLKQHVKIKHHNGMLHYFVKVQPSFNMECYLIKFVCQQTERMYGYKMNK
jgi:hypothetical protein